MLYFLVISKGVGCGCVTHHRSNLCTSEYFLVLDKESRKRSGLWTDALLLT